MLIVGKDVSSSGEHTGSPSKSPLSFNGKPPVIINSIYPSHTYSSAFSGHAILESL